MSSTEALEQPKRLRRYCADVTTSMTVPARTSVVFSGPTHDGAHGMSGSSRPHAVVHVSARLYAVCWWAVLCMHLFTAVFVLFAGFVHVVLSIDVFHHAMSALAIPVPLKRAAGCGYLVVASLHVRAVQRMVSQSLPSRNLTLEHTIQSQGSRHSAASISRIQAIKIVRGPRRLLAFLSRMQEMVLGPDGYFGINGAYFTSSLLVREAVEVAMQTYQLWSLSYNVSRVWINVLAVVTVVLNCLSIPIVHFIFHRHLGRERLMHLVADMFLDFTSAMVVPVCILFPYFLQFDWSINQYPFRLLIDDVWFANAIAEARQVMVTSYLDLVSSLLPQYSIYSCLRLIKRLVKRRQEDPKGGRKQRAIAPQPQTDAATEITTTLKANDAIIEIESRGVRFVSACIAVWAVAVLGFHFHAYRFALKPEYPGCQLYVRPWFATNLSCSVLQVNCHRWNTTGSPNDIASILDPLERSVLGKVIITHCPMLTVPTKLVEFPCLKVFVVFNSTVVDWPAEAAIRQATQPMVSDVYFSRSNLSVIPAGLLHNELPQSLRLVAFYNTTLQELPNDLGALWANTQLVRIGLQFTHVRAVPASFGRMRSLQKLWMAKNPIASFPDDVFTNSAFVSIRLSGMPLQRLPNTVGDTTKLTELIVEYTNISDLPAWAVAWLDAHSDKDDKEIRSFYGSPVCDPINTTWSAKVSQWRICERDRQSQYGEFSGGVLDNHFPV